MLAKRFLISLAPKIKATLFSSTNMFLVAGTPHVCLYCAQCICLVFPYLDKPKHVCLIPPPGPRLTWPRTELENRSLAAADISSRKHSKLGNRRKESQNKIQLEIALTLLLSPCREVESAISLFVQHALGFTQRPFRAVECGGQ